VTKRIPAFSSTILSTFYAACGCSWLENRGFYFYGVPAILTSPGVFLVPQTATLSLGDLQKSAPNMEYRRDTNGFALPPTSASTKSVRAEQMQKTAYRCLGAVYQLHHRI
jgi:hypothetical protein